MKNTIGDNVRLTLWGESHSKYIGVVLDGICPGIKIDEDFIKEQLSKRRPNKKIETSRVETDNFQIASGVFNGYTTGEAISIIIENNDTKSKDYEQIKEVARPSHADYTAYVKAKGYNDYRGGGHFSGRLTACIVAAGAILIKALQDKNIYIGTHIKKCGNVVDREFGNVENDIHHILNKSFPTLDDVEDQIKEEILKVASANDSIGGILQTGIVNLPAGLGDAWFSSVEGKIANALFSIGAVKGVEFGKGFSFSEMVGSDANDSFYINNNKVYTKTNHNGGINGGITNGMPVVFNTAVKPTPSISKEQDTINFKTLENTKLTINGRHDPAIIRRMTVVIDSIVAIVVADLLATRYGNYFLDFED